MNWLRNFLVGKNGMDQLSIAVIIIAMLLNLVARNLSSDIPGILAIVLIAWAVFRILSRNIEKRRQENLRFTKILYSIKNGFGRLKTDRTQSRTYKYFPCPGCKNRLRVPKGKGKLNITCPKCGQRFSRKT